MSILRSYDFKFNLGMSHSRTQKKNNIQATNIIISFLSLRYDRKKTHESIFSSW